MGKQWVPLESNPEVLNRFVEKTGLDTSKCSFSDVYGLDEELLAMVPQPVLALILCFPITEQSEAAAKQEDAELAAAARGEAQPDGAAGQQQPFYMKQTIGNACGTIAVLHSIGNNVGLDSVSIAPGSFLSQFFEATQGMTPLQVGAFLEDPPQGAPDIEEAHMAAAAEGDTAPPAADDDVNLHFVAFVHKNGKLWQLDGRRQGPVCHGPTTPEELLPAAVKVVKSFMERANSITFNLLALTGNPA